MWILEENFALRTCILSSPSAENPSAGPWSVVRSDIRRIQTTATNNGVKVNAKQREQLLDVLKPNIKAIVKEGVEHYIGNGTRFMLELLMHAETQERCGKWHSRSEKRETVRWGKEKGTAIIDGVDKSER